MAEAHDTFGCRRTLSVDGTDYTYYSLTKAAQGGLGDISRLPFSLKVLLENLLRHEDGRTVTADDLHAVARWVTDRTSDREIPFRPARVLMQDFTGVPAVVDLAAMRDAMAELGGDPGRINPLNPVDLVVDHSVMVDHYGTADAYQRNMEAEFKRNGERYAFLRWGQEAFNNFSCVPPGTGICHQVNLEYLAQVAWPDKDSNLVYCDTLVGTDSHTTMVNGLSVLGWGVGGIEAEAAMLGQPISMVLPEVVGFRLTGSLPEGTTATDLVLTVTQMLREKGVVGKFVEFFGPALDNLPLPDRATIANMAPEYGATCGIFPIDAETLRYLEATGRSDHQVKLVGAYAHDQGLWRDETTPEPVFTDTLELNLADVEPSLAGPRRPQDRVALSDAARGFRETRGQMGISEPREQAVGTKNWKLRDGAVVIAAITSCTNTSNPSVLMTAGLVAKNAVDKGLMTRPWVKTSLAPGSQVVMDYLKAAGLQDYLDHLGFTLAGYGCTTCIGNSGPLDPEIREAVEAQDLVVASVLSGNRNFEGRINPHVKANYLASPPLVVAYALAGHMEVDLYNDPLGTGPNGEAVYLKDLWPSAHEVQQAIGQYVSPRMFRDRYGNVFEGTEAWKTIDVPKGRTYAWDSQSTYVKRPPFFEGLSRDLPPVTDITGARPLAILGDSVTTDHISPAGAIKTDSPAGRYLMEKGVQPEDFNSYGARRGNHEVMMRGTFANIRIRNEMVPGTEGGVTRLMPDDEQMAIYDAAMAYQERGTPLVVVAGTEYGTGSSRDWAAKGTRLLGVQAVVAESYERIHRSNLVGMGVLPLQFVNGESRTTLGLDGSETFDITGLEAGLAPRQRLTLTVHRADGSTTRTETECRIDTLDELEYYRNGGILPYVLRRMTG